ncbi:MAG: four helix bundle protein [Marinilabiliales bacterium]|nr:MAG: four helix bundle protein [Marinilabiliales bacterium]
MANINYSDSLDIEITNFNEPELIYNLEERTFQFAKNTRLFITTLPKITANIEDSKQVVRSSGSVGANYIEANENLGEKDFLMRLKICRKEAKESAFFLRLIKETNDNEYEKEAHRLLQEAKELTKIFSAIIKNVKQ